MFVSFLMPVFATKTQESATADFVGVQAKAWWTEGSGFGAWRGQDTFILHFVQTGDA